MSTHHEVLIIGGGTGGLTVAARLCALDGAPDVGIIEPAEKHYYQPIWTLVGAGIFPREMSERDEADYIPAGATWIRDAVATFDPDTHSVKTAGGKTITYDQLVVAPGIQVNWDQIEGLQGALGKDGVCSNYSYDYVESTARFIREFSGGRAVFTFPNTPIKCAGAPQKIMYLAEEAFRKQGVRDRSEVLYAAPGGAIFGIPKYRAALEKIIRDRGIDTLFGHDLRVLRPASKEAVFHAVDGGAETIVKYDLIHVTPPMSAPDFVRESPLADAAGWVDVDKHTMQHPRFPNVFSLGDASSLPCSKTGAAIRKQAPALVENLLAQRSGGALTGHYDGYASCPLVTGVGKVILAEFGYDGVIMETFPFDQAKERYSMYALKAYGLPGMYWHGMLQGRV